MGRMVRRLFVLLLWLSATLPAAVRAQTGEPLRIWDGTQVDKPKVTLTPFLAQEQTGNIAVIVCPGGSYCWLDYETEGEGVARWLQANGISAFVLRYRVAGIWSWFSHDRLLFRKRQYPDMVEDVQRAIQLVRENAGHYGIDPQKVGVMGFSAGGHLAITSGTFFGTDFLASHGIECGVSLRPDFISPIYPVVTMSDKRYAHRRSRRGSLGEYRNNRKVWRDSLSMERHVREDMPPVFLMNCVDDPIVKYQNSELLDAALTEKNVEHKYIQYRVGGHGFGATPDKTSEEAIAWREEFLEWVKQICRVE